MYNEPTTAVARTRRPDSTTPAVDSYRCLARGLGLGSSNSLLERRGGALLVLEVGLLFLRDVDLISDT